MAGRPTSRSNQSWLGVPLVAAGTVLGILSLGAQAQNVFASEHLRLAKSLAVAAAVAIKNARVHERAEIYASELEINLRELRDTQRGARTCRTQIPPTHNRLNDSSLLLLQLFIKPSRVAEAHFLSQFALTRRTSAFSSER